MVLKRDGWRKGEQDSKEGLLIKESI